MIQSQYVKGKLLKFNKRDLSKVLMYEFHYDYIKMKYGNKLRLLFTATDSLMYEIKINDVY